MCVIAYVPKEKNVSDGDLEKCYEKNSDSIGYMFAHGGKIHIRKFLDFDLFLDSYKKEKEKYVADFALHFRIKTSGKIDLENCHPFLVGSQFALMHNGVISGIGNDTKSDTNIFATEILGPLIEKYSGLLEEPVFRTIVGSAIGPYNKLVLMKNDGSAYIVHEKQGDWIDGVWYSNKLWTYCYSATTAAYTNTDYKVNSFFKLSKKERKALPKGDKAYPNYYGLPCTVCRVLTRNHSMICHHCMETL